MPDEDLEQTIIDAVSGPKKATGDNGSAEKFSIDELIKADQYLASKRRTGTGLQFNKIAPQGGP